MAFAEVSKTCCVITGASRGFGRATAFALAHAFAESGCNSHFILLSRDEKKLQETRNGIMELDSYAKVHTVVADLGEMKTLEETVNNALSKVEPNQVSHAILLNNAGSIGDISNRIKDMTNIRAESLQDYFNLNISSPMFLISKFLKRFEGSSCTVINVSSLMAVESFSHFSLYCAGKAARDMMCQVLAKEEPDVRVLNYAPGPLSTDMYDEICNTCGNQELAAEFQKGQDENKILSSSESARKLVSLLREDVFASGSHVDYYDC
ncbi:sepiapterin reductase-like isoform X1 [Acropora muricata]|uniref:sepiapterin reductase-like isoform X1 n=1 Tax=Acropora muricata TaxID=159855 RepID=UPI0010FC9941